MVRTPEPVGISIRRWTGICAALMLMVIVLSGCLDAKPLSVSNQTNPTLFVDYHRTGGIAGVNDRLVIFDNGVGLVSSRTTSREILLNQSDLKQISAIFDEGQFQALEGNFTSRRRGADLMQYSINYQGKTIITEDTAIPPSLEPVIKEMNRILSTGLNGGQSDFLLPTIDL
jgi:hypothetical protein